MSRWRPSIAAAAFALLTGPALAAGTLPFALQQQFSFTNCATGTNACGTPLIGGLLYFYQAGTVATRQDSFSDTALTLVNPWPLQLDANGRVPFFYLADGSIHVRLTDSNGVPQYDNTVLVIGPSSGAGGGSTIDPTTIAATGDVKFRQTGEVLSGWVKLNGLTIGSATSGATGRANADTQALFIYLWTNCDNTHCPVAAGRGASGLADFSANKTLAMPDWRARTMVGLDDMGAAAAGRLTGALFAGADTATTPGGNGGEAAHTLTQAQLPLYNLNVTDPGHTHTLYPAINISAGGGGPSPINGSGAPDGHITGSSSTGISVSSAGSNASHNVMSPFTLGSWYMKL